MIPSPEDEAPLFDEKLPVYSDDEYAAFPFEVSCPRVIK